MTAERLYHSWQAALTYITTEKIQLSVNVIAVTKLCLHYDAPCISCFHLSVLPAARSNV